MQNAAAMVEMPKSKIPLIALDELEPTQSTSRTLTDPATHARVDLGRDIISSDISQKSDCTAYKKEPKRSIVFGPMPPIEEL